MINEASILYWDSNDFTLNSSCCDTLNVSGKTFLVKGVCAFTTLNIDAALTGTWQWGIAQSIGNLTTTNQDKIAAFVNAETAIAGLYFKNNSNDHSNCRVHTDKNSDSLDLTVAGSASVSFSINPVSKGQIILYRDLSHLNIALTGDVSCKHFTITPSSGLVAGDLVTLTNENNYAVVATISSESQPVTIAPLGSYSFNMPNTDISIQVINPNPVYYTATINNNISPLQLIYDDYIYTAGTFQFIAEDTLYIKNTYNNSINYALYENNVQKQQGTLSTNMSLEYELPASNMGFRCNFSPWGTTAIYIDF